jgi:hypothetical protein
VQAEDLARLVVHDLELELAALDLWKRGPHGGADRAHDAFVVRVEEAGTVRAVRARRVRRPRLADAHGVRRRLDEVGLGGADRARRELRGKEVAEDGDAARRRPGPREGRVRGAVVLRRQGQLEHVRAVDERSAAAAPSEPAPDLVLARARQRRPGPRQRRRGFNGDGHRAFS